MSALVRGTTWKHNGDFYCLNFLRFFRAVNKLECHEKYKCKNIDFCGIALPTQKNNMLKFKQYMKPDKTPCIIY